MANQQKRTLDFIVTMWQHFQDAINSRVFKSPDHLEYLKQEEKRYRTLYLKETCDEHDLFTELGFDTDHRNQFCLS